MGNPLQQYVDEYATLTEQQEKTKERLDWLRGYFEKQAAADLKDTKLKTMEYWGSANTQVVVTNSETVKPVSLIMVRELLGKIAPDFVKEETSWKMTDPCKRLLGMVCQGNYTEGSLADTIASITDDAKIAATLKKRLKGNYDRDKKVLMQVAGLDEEHASDWAYLAAEVINWEWLAQILKAAEWKGSTEEAIAIIKAAIKVEESIKVTLNAEKADVQEAPEADKAG